MSYTVDNCVILRALSKYEDGEACLRFIASLIKKGEQLLQPAGFTLEMFSVYMRNVKANKLNMSHFEAMGWGQTPLAFQALPVTKEDIDAFLIAPDGINQADWATKLLAVRPAYDLEYAIVARKSGSTLVSTDKRMLDFRESTWKCEIQPSYLSLCE